MPEVFISLSSFIVLFVFTASKLLCISFCTDCMIHYKLFSYGEWTQKNCSCLFLIEIWNLVFIIDISVFLSLCYLFIYFIFVSIECQAAPVISFQLSPHCTIENCFVSLFYVSKKIIHWCNIVMNSEFFFVIFPFTHIKDLNINSHTVTKKIKLNNSFFPCWKFASHSISNESPGEMLHSAVVKYLFILDSCNNQ